MGYAIDRKAYTILLPDTNTLVTARSVSFDEARGPESFVDGKFSVTLPYGKPFKVMLDNSTSEDFFPGQAVNVGGSSRDLLTFLENDSSYEVTVTDGTSLDHEGIWMPRYEHEISKHDPQSQQDLGEIPILERGDVERLPPPTKKKVRLAPAEYLASMACAVLATLHPAYICTVPKSETLGNNKIKVKYHTVYSLDQDALTPETLKQALGGSDAQKWVDAMNAEISALEENGTWVLEELPEGRRTVRCRWVYKIKTENGVVTKYKARLVAKGFTQLWGVDYDDTFAPVVSYPTLRILLLLCATVGIIVKHADIGNAYLKAFLKANHIIYMDQPAGYQKFGPNGERLVCRLLKSLYGLKQAGREWNHTLNAFLIDYGFVRSKVDPCLYIFRRGEDFLAIVLWVDDIFGGASTDDLWENFVESLRKQYEKVTGGGELTWSLGTEFQQTTKGLLMTLSTYITDQAKKFGLIEPETNKPVRAMPKTPLPEKNLTEFPVPIIGSDEFKENQKQPYREIVGVLLYIMVVCRPDIAYATAMLSQFCNNHAKGHWEAAKRTLRYLLNTKTLGIFMPQDPTGNDVFFKIRVETDASYAACKTTRRSHTGTIWYINNVPVMWKSNRQSVVALHACEAEYIAIADAVRENKFLRMLLFDFGVEVGTPRTRSQCLNDNEAAIILGKEPALRKRTRHIDVRLHFVQEEIAEERTTLEWISTVELSADSLTKSLAADKLLYLRPKYLSG
jgi:hypothetical protein